MWLNQLKIALIEKNVENINKLLDNLPHLEKAQEIEEALYLLKEATSLVQGLKDKTEASMVQMQKNIKFLNSATANKTAKFDITS
jgi:predicted translin family RNA/ssDNA-binding protein